MDNPPVSEEQKVEYPEHYGQNIWPSATEKGVEGFDVAFKSLGKSVSRDSAPRYFCQ